MDAKNGKGGVKIKGEEEEEKDDADVTFTATDSDLYDILTGEQDATQAYFGVSCNTQKCIKIPKKQLFLLRTNYLILSNSGFIYGIYCNLGKVDDRRESDVGDETEQVPKVSDTHYKYFVGLKTYLF